MAAEVTAAWVAAAAATLSLAVNAYITLWSGHRRREQELVIEALSHFGGKTQERNAGLAVIRLLIGTDATKATDLGTGPTSILARRRRKAAIRQYRPAIESLFYGQAVYLLNTGENRHRAHEIANIVVMTEWLLTDLNHLRQVPGRVDGLKNALNVYRNTKPSSPGSNVDIDAVNDLINLIVDDWLNPTNPRLK